LAKIHPRYFLNKTDGGLGGFHSEPRPVTYFPEQAERIIEWIINIDPISARALHVMQKTGLRIREAVYLRAQDIDVATCFITLEGNVNHTKGGRPRQVRISPEETPFLSEIKAIGEKNPTGHIFHDRGSLPDRVREQVRKACKALGIPCLGTHGFRKTFAAQNYKNRIEAGADDDQAQDMIAVDGPGLPHILRLCPDQFLVAGEIFCPGDITDGDMPIGDRRFQPNELILFLQYLA